MSQSSALHRMAAGDFQESTLDPAPGNLGSCESPEGLENLQVGSLNDRSRTQVQAQFLKHRVKPRAADQSLKVLAVPLFTAIALLLLVPAIWGTLVLSGMSIWQSQREGAHAMAIAMLVAWPIALSLFAGAGFFFWQLRKNTRR